MRLALSVYVCSGLKVRLARVREIEVEKRVWVLETKVESIMREGSGREVDIIYHSSKSDLGTAKDTRT